VVASKPDARYTTFKYPPNSERLGETVREWLYWLQGTSTHALHTPFFMPGFNLFYGFLQALKLQEATGLGDLIGTLRVLNPQSAVTVEYDSRSVR
jgi:hypothetical protein